MSKSWLKVSSVCGRVPLPAGPGSHTAWLACGMHRNGRSTPLYMLLGCISPGGLPMTPDWKGGPVGDKGHLAGWRNLSPHLCEVREEYKWMTSLEPRLSIPDFVQAARKILNETPGFEASEWPLRCLCTALAASSRRGSTGGHPWRQATPSSPSSVHMPHSCTPSVTPACTSETGRQLRPQLPSTYSCLSWQRAEKSDEKIGRLMNHTSHCHGTKSILCKITSVVLV